MALAPSASPSLALEPLPVDRSWLGAPDQGGPGGGGVGQSEKQANAGQGVRSAFCEYNKRILEWMRKPAACRRRAGLQGGARAVGMSSRIPAPSRLPTRTAAPAASSSDGGGYGKPASRPSSSTRNLGLAGRQEAIANAEAARLAAQRKAEAQKVEHEKARARARSAQKQRDTKAAALRERVRLEMEAESKSTRERALQRLEGQELRSDIFKDLVAPRARPPPGDRRLSGEPSPSVGVHTPTAPITLADKVHSACGALGVDDNRPIVEALAECNRQAGLDSTGTLLQQADALIDKLGIPVTRRQPAAAEPEHQAHPPNVTESLATPEKVHSSSSRIKPPNSSQMPSVDECLYARKSTGNSQGAVEEAATTAAARSSAAMVAQQRMQAITETKAAMDAEIKALEKRRLAREAQRNSKGNPPPIAAEMPAPGMDENAAQPLVDRSLFRRPLLAVTSVEATVSKEKANCEGKDERDQYGTPPMATGNDGSELLIDPSLSIRPSPTSPTEERLTTTTDKEHEDVSSVPEVEGSGSSHSGPTPAHLLSTVESPPATLVVSTM